MNWRCPLLAGIVALSPLLGQLLKRLHSAVHFTISITSFQPGLTHPISSLLSHVKAVHPNHPFSSPPILTEKKQYSQSTSPTPRLRSKPNPSLNRRNSCLGQSTQAHDYHRHNMQYTVTEATSTATWRIRRGRMCVRGTCRFYSCGLRMFIASAESAELAYCSRFEILLLSIERCDASTA